MTQTYDEILKNLFIRNRKCVINTDLDGLLSGMFLQEFLGWEIVGFSSCCGKPNDNLWLREDIVDISDCVFVDLPVIINNISVIDQHYVAFNKEGIEKYSMNNNKINPNIMRSRFFLNNDYTKKYPFGTVHFILAALERLNLIPLNYKFEFNKKIKNFDLADLLLRADMVIGNTFSYSQNCLDWCEWIIEFGAEITKTLFNTVKAEYKTRKTVEQNVELELQNFGCNGSDGECSNLFRKRENKKLEEYFKFLAIAFEMKPIPVFIFKDYNKFEGRRITINDFNEINKILKQSNMFSFAFVSKKVLSVTYIRGEKKDG